MGKSENINPLVFNNVHVWASSGRHGYPPADAIIKDLDFENSGTVLGVELTQ